MRSNKLGDVVADNNYSYYYLALGFSHNESDFYYQRFSHRIQQIYKRDQTGRSTSRISMYVEKKRCVEEKTKSFVLAKN